MRMSKKIRRNLWKKSCASLLCLTFSLAPVLSAAAAEQEDKSFTLDEVVVTANRVETPKKDVTTSVTVITQEMIQKSSAKMVTDLLALVPGVAINNRGGLGNPGSISIRGLNGGGWGSKKVLMLMDGRPMNNASDNSIDWNTVPLENIERIEVVRGPVSALYGGSSLSGAINIITKKPDKDATTVNTSYGTYGTSMTSIIQEGKSGNVGYVFTADHGQTDGFVPHSDYKGDNYSLRLDFDDNLIFRSGYNQYDKTNYPEKDDTEDQYSYSKVYAHYFDLEKKFTSGNISSSIRAYQNVNNSKKFDKDTWNNSSNWDDKTTGFMFQQDVQASNQQTFTWGSEYQKLTAINNLKGKEYSSNSYALFLQNSQRLAPRLLLNMGGRYDHHSAYGGQFSPKVGLAYNTSPDTTWKMNIARAFKAPTLNDLYVGKGKRPGNPDLKPTKEWSYELGVEKQFNPTTRGSIMFYKMVADNNIIRGSNPTPTNADMEPQGFEAEINRKVNEHLDFFANYTYLDVGKMTFYATRHKANAGINYKNGDYQIALTQSFVGSTWDDDAVDKYGNANTRNLLDKYSLTDIKLTYSLQPNVTATFGVDNLFNASYKTWNDYPAPGRIYTGSLSMRF